MLRLLYSISSISSAPILVHYYSNLLRLLVLPLPTWNQREMWTIDRIINNNYTRFYRKVETVDLIRSRCHPAAYQAVFHCSVVSPAGHSLCSLSGRQHSSSSDEQGTATRWRWWQRRPSRQLRRLELWQRRRHHESTLASYLHTIRTLHAHRLVTQTVNATHQLETLFHFKIYQTKWRHLSRYSDHWWLVV